MKVLTELGSRDSANILIQLVDEHDMSFLEKEAEHISNILGSKDYRLIPVNVDNWNSDLSPWESPPVFGDEPFGSGAKDTLEFLLKEVIPDALGRGDVSTATGDDDGKSKIYIGGYSLAGLFALWACCNTDIFAGVAAVSPSVWFPGFLDYVKNGEPKTGAIYLSLGDKEEKTRNRTMATVGDSIRSIHEHLTKTGIKSVLEWNQGNHFKEPDLRMAKGFAWLIK